MYEELTIIILVNDNGHFQLHIPMLIVAVRCNVLTSVIMPTWEVTGCWDTAEMIHKEETIIHTGLSNPLQYPDWKLLKASGYLHVLEKEMYDVLMQIEKLRAINSLNGCCCCFFQKNHKLDKQTKSGLKLFNARIKI